MVRPAPLSAAGLSVRNDRSEYCQGIFGVILFRLALRRKALIVLECSEYRQQGMVRICRTVCKPRQILS
jgi:hypothetical protein